MLQKNSWRPETPIRIGEFAVDPVSNEISANGVTTRLRPILMDVLLRLAANPGAAVSRETLLNDVWARRMVNDEVLSRAIAELRTALCDDPKSPRYIETLPKVGYRMVAAVEAAPHGFVPRADAGAARAQTPLEHDIAYPLPFDGGVPDASSPRRPESRPDHAEDKTTGTDSYPAPAKPVRSIWKLIRLPIIGIAVLVLLGVYKQQSKSEPAIYHVNLERQINAAVPFATSPQSESTPRFSSDGSSVVFARSSATSSEIVVQDVASGAQRVFSVPGSRVASPVFLPDGRFVAYWRRSVASSSPSDRNDCAIAVRSLDTDSTYKVVGCDDRPQPVFDLTPDGSSLIYSALPRAEFPLALMQHDLKTKTTKQLTSPAPGEGHDLYPRISPDGKTVAFFRGTQSHVRLWTLALGDAGAPQMPKPVSAFEGLAYGVTWTPQTSMLIAAADWLGFRALNSVALAPDGRSSAQLLGARGARFPDMHKNGNIVFETATYRADLWLTSADRPGEGAQIAWPSTRYTNQAQFSPDGKRVAFASNRSGGDSIHIADASALSGEARTLPLPDNARYIQPHWSANGSEVFAVQIAIIAAKPAEQRAVRINVASGKFEVLTHFGTQINNVVPLNNGREVIYGELTDHAMRLYRADIEGGTPKRLPLPLASNFAIVENDLVYTQPQLTGATRCQLDTMACAPIKVELDDNNRFDWALGKNVIWHLGRDDARKAALVRVDLTTGERRTFDFAPSAAGTNIAVSRDGKSLLVAREAPPVIDLMIAKPVNAR